MHNNGSRLGTTPHSILVVDDEPSIIDCVATALRYEGYDVDEATSGHAALAAIAQCEPALIVLDWMMPDLEGIHKFSAASQHDATCVLREPD